MTFALSLLLLCPSPARAAAPGVSDNAQVIVEFDDGSSVAGDLVSLTEKRIALDVDGRMESWSMDSVVRLEKPGSTPSAGQVRDAYSPPASYQPSYPAESPAPAQYAPYQQPPSQAQPAYEPAPVTAPPPTGYASSLPYSQAVQTPPPIGYASAPYYPANYAYPAVLLVEPAPQFTPQEQKEFLRGQAEAREKHFQTAFRTPESDLQFNLQQALDRSARGLPFNRP